MKTAIVTGAGRGLGLSITKELLSRGYAVGAMVRKQCDSIDKLIAAYGADRVFYLYADVTDTDAVKATVEVFKKNSDRLDAIYNVAAVMIPQAELPIDDDNFSPEKMLDEFNVNSVGPVRVVSAYLPVIKSAPASCPRITVINISSEAGSIGYHFARTDQFAYQMSKTALNFATKVMNQAYCKYRFRAFAVDPGWMRTDMGGQAATLDPADSARDIVDLAEGENRPYFYMNRKGVEYKW